MKKSGWFFVTGGGGGSEEVWHLSQKSVFFIEGFPNLDLNWIGHCNYQWRRQQPGTEGGQFKRDFCNNILTNWGWDESCKTNILIKTNSFNIHIHNFEGSNGSRPKCCGSKNFWKDWRLMIFIQIVGRIAALSGLYYAMRLLCFMSSINQNQCLVEPVYPCPCLHWTFLHWFCLSWMQSFG